MEPNKKVFTWIDSRLLSFMTFDLTGPSKKGMKKIQLLLTLPFLFFMVSCATEARMDDKTLVCAMWNAKQAGFGDEQTKGMLGLDKSSNAEQIKMFCEFFAR